MQYRDPVTGNKKRKSSGERTKREAERAAAKWETELRQGLGAVASRMSWEDFRQRCEDEALSALADTTADTLELNTVDGF